MLFIKHSFIARPDSHSQWWPVCFYCICINRGPVLPNNCAVDLRTQSERMRENDKACAAKGMSAKHWLWCWQFCEAKVAPTLMVRWLQRCSAEPKDATSTAAMVAAFQMEVESKCTSVSRLRWRELIRSAPLRRASQPKCSFGKLNPIANQSNRSSRSGGL